MKDADIAGLVERLRNVDWDGMNNGAICHEAADALEAAKAEIARLKDINLKQSLQVAEKMDEFLRLRAALEKIGHMLVDMEIDRLKDEIDDAFCVVSPFFDEEKDWGTPRAALKSPSPLGR